MIQPTAEEVQRCLEAIEDPRIDIRLSHYKRLLHQSEQLTEARAIAEADANAAALWRRVTFALLALTAALALRNFHNPLISAGVIAFAAICGIGLVLCEALLRTT